MKVLHVIAPAPIGGAETVVLGLCEGLAAIGLDSHVAAIVDEGAPHEFVDAAHARGIALTRIEAGHRRYLRQARAIAATARLQGAHVIHTHGFHADVIGSMAARRAGRPVVTTLHGFTGGSGIRDRVHDVALRYVHKRADSIIAVSSTVAALLASRGVRRERLHLIPNAVAGRSEPTGRVAARDALGIASGIAASGARIGWVGRLSREKGPDVMVRALAHCGATLSVLGDGPMRRELEALATDAGVAPRITWHGAVADAYRYYPAFDLIVLSSRSEGAPMVLLEAMKHGIPVVATSVGGIPEIVADTGIPLAPPEDPAALGQAIAAALGDPDSTRRTVVAARARFDAEYDPARWAARHRDVYFSVVRGR